jgi:hypothetical protein
VAYQEFLRANGINPEDLSQKEYSDLLNTQDMYNDDLIHFSKSENCKDVGTFLGCSQAGQGLGESGQGKWDSPTVEVEAEECGVSTAAHIRWDPVTKCCCEWV